MYGWMDEWMDVFVCACVRACASVCLCVGARALLCLLYIALYLDFVTALLLTRGSFDILLYVLPR